jgi:hypothetical protein
MRDETFDDSYTRIMCLVMRYNRNGTTIPKSNISGISNKSNISDKLDIADKLDRTDILVIVIDKNYV